MGSLKSIPVSNQTPQETLQDAHYFRTFILDEWGVHLYAIPSSLSAYP